MIWIYFVCQALWITGSTTKCSDWTKFGDWSKASLKTKQLFEHFFVKHRQAYNYHDFALARSLTKWLNIKKYQGKSCMCRASVLRCVFWGVYSKLCIVRCVFWGVYSLVCILKCVSWGVCSEMCILICVFWDVYSEVGIMKCVLWGVDYEVCILRFVFNYI